MTADELEVLVRKLLRGVDWSDPYYENGDERSIHFDWGNSEPLTEEEFALCKKLYREIARPGDPA